MDIKKEEADILAQLTEALRDATEAGVALARSQKELDDGSGLPDVYSDMAFEQALLGASVCGELVNSYAQHLRDKQTLPTSSQSGG